MAVDTLDVAPALGRGRYDRRLTAEERSAKQRERLLRGTARLIARQGRRALTVSNIVSESRSGRNTFYEHFGGIDEALKQLEALAVERIVGAVERASAETATPTERLRAIARAWVDSVVEHRELARALVGRSAARGDTTRDLVTQRLRAVLSSALSQARRDYVVTCPPDELRIAAVTAATEAIGLFCLENPSARAEAPKVVVDLLLRTFR